MTEHDFEAHRHIKGNLELLFRDALDMPDLSIERTLGGMSNFNMLADCKHESLVLRIPVLLIEYPSTHYAQEFLILYAAAQKGLSPRPLTYGTLANRNQTPFLVYDYEPGIVHSSLSPISIDEFRRLEHSLDQLQNLEVLGVPTYSSPMEYLHYLRSRVDSVLSASELQSERMRRARFSVDELHGSLETILDGVSWSKSAMHSDLRPSNVIFQKDRVLFLDWSEFCRGFANYDFAYFLSEPIEPFSSDILVSFASTNTTEMFQMRSLALFSCISWTLERLIRCELGQVPPNLSNDDIVESMETYVRMQIDQLIEVLKHL
ncbi:MAG: aminoglycoside phosphotransferase family protein [Candidatus Thorarchaeota archaeon]|jgi:aminoglycoside phosphotransferase (APT) family kinase protein